MGIDGSGRKFFVLAISMLATLGATIFSDETRRSEVGDEKLVAIRVLGNISVVLEGGESEVTPEILTKEVSATVQKYVNLKEGSQESRRLQSESRTSFFQFEERRPVSSTPFMESAAANSRIFDDSRPVGD